VVGVPTDASGTGVRFLDGLDISGNMGDGDAAFTIDAGSSASLGRVVRFVPDLNADGFDEIAVGLPGASGGEGAVAIFFGEATPTGSWTVNSDADILITGTDAGGAFGEQLLILGDTGTDGLPELVVGAPDAVSSAGRVYLFASEDYATAASLTASDRVLRITGGSSGDQLNVTRVNHDIDDDGIPDLVLGAPGVDDVFNNSGEIYLYPSNQ